MVLYHAENWKFRPMSVCAACDTFRKCIKPASHRAKLIFVHNCATNLLFQDFYWRGHWRGLITFPSVVSLNGRLPQKLQSKSTLFCEIVQIHSLFRHGFIKKPKSKFNRKKKKKCILFLCDGFRKSDLGIDLIANAFQGSIQNTRLFSIFSLFIFCSIIYIFEKRKEHSLAYRQRIV